MPVPDETGTQLDPQLGADVADDDIFFTVDISDATMDPTGTTKKITRAELPAALGLGKYVAVGYQGKPTWISPAAADWADVVANNLPWAQLSFSTNEVDIFVGTGDGSGPYVDIYAVPGEAAVSFASGTGNIESHAFADARGVGFSATALSGQTGLLLDLQDSNFTTLLGLAPDGSVGGVAPTVGGAIRWDGTAWVASAT